jgi:phosphopantothenoylcysteine synthetase/decarboxylase
MIQDSLMRCIVTCGPAWEPIDRVRRITNFSTGELGLILSAALVRAGHEVLCLKGEAATAAGEPAGVEIVPFSTNDDLQVKLEAEAGRAGAIFHTAALCDFRVKAIKGDDGHVISAAKIPSRGGGLSLELEPAVKVLPLLRGWFPQAQIVGWKYELDGTGDEALEKAVRLREEARTDACVLNGAAWGAGFGFLLPGHAAHPLANKAELSDYLAAWISLAQS